MAANVVDLWNGTGRLYFKHGGQIQGLIHSDLVCQGDGLLVDILHNER
jgi:hypothetical protein